jgi:hypothetical protein
MNPLQEWRLDPAFGEAEARQRSYSGCRRSPRRSAKLTVLLVLLARKGCPVWSRELLAQFAGYKSVHGVDKAIQALIQRGEFTPDIRPEPGRNARGPSIRRPRYLMPAPDLKRIVEAKVRWPRLDPA